MSVHPAVRARCLVAAWLPARRARFLLVALLEVGGALGLATHGDGRTEEVQGEGVVGEQPKLQPGQAFQYTSAAIISTPVGTMHGSYQMVGEDGTQFDAEIAPFRLATQGSLH